MPEENDIGRSKVRSAGKVDAVMQGKFLEIVWLAGFRTLTFIVLPMLIGSTLPFWLDSAEFIFRWFAAFEFLIAAVFFYSGFSFLRNGFELDKTALFSKSRQIWIGVVCLLMALVLGLHLNQHIGLNPNVHPNIFLFFLAAAVFLGILYTLPPFSFSKRIGGEVIFSVGLGMMPVIGAYLLQAGDLHRTAYLASMPAVVSTGLWLWLTKVISRDNDQKAGNSSIVLLFSPKFSGRYLTLLITILIYLTIFLAVFGRSSLSPYSLLASVTIPLAFKIVFISWNGYGNMRKMKALTGKAYILHFVVCTIIILSSLSEII